MRSAIWSIGIVFAMTGCEQPQDTTPASANVIVTPTAFEFLGQKYQSIADLSAAVDANTQIQIGLSVAEEQGCVSEVRVANVMDMLKQRKHADVSFVGHSTVLDVDGRQPCLR